MQRRRLVTVSALLFAFILIATFGVIQIVSANASKIDVATLNVNPGATGFLIPVTVTTQDDPGMSAFDVTVTFNNSVINITGAQDGPSGFSLTPNFSAGSTRVASFTTGSPVNGTFTLFNLVANAVGSPGASTNLTLTITDYGDANGDPITIGTTQNGSVTINTLPTFSIAPTTTSVNEASSTVSFTVSMTPSSSAVQTVDVNTIAGTATAGSDYTTTSLSLSFAISETSKIVTVPILQDTLDEADETFQVVLSNPNSGSLVSSAAGTATVTITDDDLDPTVAVNVTTITQAEGNSTANITFQANLSTASGQPVTVDFATQNGTATAGSDYTANSGTLSFAAGQIVATSSIQILGDTAYEADETFSIVLTNGITTKATSSISITSATTLVTLNNDDTPVANNDSYSTNEDTPLTVASTTGVLANDPSFFSRSASIVANGTKGTAVLATDGGFTYTPNLNANGNDSFTYHYTADSLVSNTATVSISITAVNDAPVAVDDLISAAPNTASVANIITNDSDVDGTTPTVQNASSISASNLTPTISGVSLSVTTAGVVTYNPGSSNVGQSFTYTATDGLLTDTATVTFSQGPTFFVSVLTSTVDEDGTSPTIDVEVKLVNASTSSASTIKLSASQASSTARLGTDIGAIPGAGTDGKLTITLGGSGGTATTTIKVPVLNDNPAVREGPETVTFVLTDASSVANNHTPLISTGSAVGNIDDTSDIPKLSIADVTLIEGTGAAKAPVTGKVIVTLTGRTKFSTEFNYSVISTSTSPAASSADFQFVSSGGPITIGPNTSADSTTTTIMVTIFDDAIDELNEIFEVRILSPVEKAGAKASVGFTDNVAAVTIEDDDNAPTLEILKPANVVESVSSATISVKLNGASGAGVKVKITSSNGTATAGSDYTSSSSTLTWNADETGIKTFTVSILDDALEEDGETVILTLSGTSTITTSPSTPGVTIATGTATLLITDDEPAAAIVTIMSDGEVMPRDGYFLIVAAPNSPALGVSSISSAVLTSPMTQTLMPIANVSEVVRKMLGLDTLRSKAVTHAWYAMAATTTGQQNIIFNVSLNYSTGSTQNVNATLNVVTARTNRNFWIQNGVNYMGLALVPNDASIANLLMQPVWNANPAFGGALSRQVTLADVIQSIFAYSFTNNAFFSSYNTADPITGADAADTLTQLAPFQGMIVRARSSVTLNTGSVINVFEWVMTNGATTSVPIKVNVQGPFLNTTSNTPLAPVSQQLRIGYNLIAPHVTAPTPFDIAFGGHGGSSFGSVYATALSFQKAVFPISMGPSAVGANVVAKIALASAGGGRIDPTLSYWVRVAGTSQPTISASGPNSGGHP